MLLGAQRATLLRVDTPEWAVVAAAWSDGTAPPVPVGHRGALDGRGIVGRMLVDPRPVRIEDFDEVGGVVAELMRELGIRRGAGGPIILGGRVWGAVTAVWPADVAMPPRDAQRAQLRRYPGSHFSAYTGQVFERMVADEVVFLTEHLRPRSAAER